MSDQKESANVKGSDLIQKIKDLVREGNITKIIIKDEKDKIVLELPLTVGLVGIALAPLWAVLGAVGAMALNYRLEIIRRDNAAKPAPASPKAPS